ncbi:potassium voltage-gated channel subfamily H member 6-like [Chiloscyllium plagiosum]|uniref:potassium voltage-gated channel subfamily H member 6-like n=1 Tax=Chiloscyllium plagiosum TaxID=36176 RepID=UPI001CB875D8|nr:potassium voltage-gated channel subfamily H member 6-like [Chiloscyllium plagiosum]
MLSSPVFSDLKEIQDTNSNAFCFIPSTGRGKSFRLKLPSLRTMTLSQQSLAKEGFDAGIDDQSDRVSLAMKDFRGPLSENPTQPEQEALIELGDKAAAQTVPEPMGQSPPNQEQERHESHLHASSSNKLTHAQSQDSFHSIRRASSVDNIEQMRSNFEKKLREKRINSGVEGRSQFSIALKTKCCKN